MAKIHITRLDELHMVLKDLERTAKVCEDASRNQSPYMAQDIRDHYKHCADTAREGIIRISTEIRELEAQRDAAGNNQQLSLWDG